MNNKKSTEDFPPWLDGGIPCEPEPDEKRPIPSHNIFEESPIPNQVPIIKFEVGTIEAKNKNLAQGWTCKIRNLVIVTDGPDGGRYALRTRKDGTTQVRKLPWL